MQHPLQVLVAGRDGAEVEALAALLRERRELHVDTRLITNGHADPLYNVAPLPDVLVFALSSAWEEELAELAARPAEQRPEILVLGDAEDEAAVMRLAMRAGARDYFARPLAEPELLGTLSQIAQQRRHAGAAGKARLTAFINARGGAGASVIAANVAEILTVEQRRAVALVDLDVQFGSAGLYLDLSGPGGLLDAVEQLENVDAAALEGYMLKHDSGVHLLNAGSDDGVVLWSDLPPERLSRLLELVSEAYDEIVLDVPRHLTAATAAVLERADQIFVVLQQSVAHLRDAKRLLNLLEGELAIAPAQIGLVLNRYERQGEVDLKAVGKALGEHRLVPLANDFRHVSEGINLGALLLETARGARLTQDVRRLAGIVAGAEQKRHRGIIASLFGG